MVSGVSLGSGSVASLLKSYYSTIDTSGDSSLSTEELAAALEESGLADDGDSASSLAAGVVDALDTDRDGALGATEFTSLGDTFGTELSSVLLSAQETADQAIADTLYSDMDTNGDGALDRDEIDSALIKGMSGTNSSDDDDDSTSAADDVLAATTSSIAGLSSRIGSAALGHLLGSLNQTDA